MLQKCSNEKVLGVFFNEPTKKHSLKEISEKSDLAHTSVKNILKEFLQNKLIFMYKEIKGKRIFPVYFANVESELFVRLKKIYNVKEIYETGLFDEIKNKFMPKSIILFGSASRGEDIENSDLDIFVESNEEEIDLRKFEKKINKKINLLFGKLNLLNKNLKQNILNGVILGGLIEI